MDTRLIAEALRKALAGGAVPAPPLPAPANPTWDVNVVRSQTDVGIEPEVFDRYVADLERDPDMRLFNETFVTVPTMGGISTSLQSIARLLLARAIASGDIGGTVESFRSYVESNSATVIFVTAVSGVTASKEVPLGPDVKLVPMASLPESVQRGDALGQNYFPRNPLGNRVSSALIVTASYGPIFYRPRLGDVSSREAQQRARRIFNLLDEARSLLSLLNVKAVYRQSWVQAVDPLMSTGIGAGSLVNLEGYFAGETAIDEAAAKELATGYFGIEELRRHKTLRIPLDRLDRSAVNRDLSDRAIDLGIALEALLLHDLEGRDRGELRFRLSLRGAWLGANDQQERVQIQKSLKEVYDLRSMAVHSGAVEPSPHNRRTIERGTELCKRLICKTIDANARIDWSALVLGSG